MWWLLPGKRDRGRFSVMRSPALDLEPWSGDGRKDSTGSDQLASVDLCVGALSIVQLHRGGVVSAPLALRRMLAGRALTTLEQDDERVSYSFSSPREANG